MVAKERLQSAKRGIPSPETIPALRNSKARAFREMMVRVSCGKSIEERLSLLIFLQEVVVLGKQEFGVGRALGIRMFAEESLAGLQAFGKAVVIVEAVGDQPMRLDRKRRFRVVSANIGKA